MSTRPLNFVFILIDDMGWADVACYGSSFHETPNIDAMARNGITFTDAYGTCPVCSPSRASILTGRYTASIGLTDWIPGFKTAPHHRMIPAPFTPHLPLEEITIARALKTAGYTTGIVGKWHLGTEAYYPENHGFDINVGATQSGMPQSYFYPDWGENPPIVGEPGEYLTDRLTREAETFIDRHKDKPFFLYLSHHAVHIPIQGKEPLVAKYRARAQDGARQSNPVYAAMVESVDDSVGRVIRKLGEAGILDRTVVFFTSDNGGLYTREPIFGAAMSNHPLRAGKGYLYEGGIREPLIVQLPGVIQPGQVCAEPVSGVDFYPTILEMAGVDRPQYPAVDGESLVPLLTGAGGLGRDAIYWHYPHYCIQENPAPMLRNTPEIGGRPGGVVRSGDFKLIEFYEDGRLELYNLRQDIGEERDLAGELPDKVRELRGMLSNWRESVNARMPTPNPDYTGEWQEEPS